MGQSHSSLVALDRQYIWHPFTQQALQPDPIAIIRGQGAYLFDEHNHKYLDLVSSWWVNCHGHSHPHIAQAIARQASTLDHVIFAGFTHEPAVTLAQRLVEITPMPLQKVFFSDNGSTSVEVAIKLAIQFWYNQNKRERTRIVSLDGAYHGDTFGAMAAGKSSHYFQPFENYFFKVDVLPFPQTWDNDPDVEVKEEEALCHARQYFDQFGHEVAGMIVEPLIQGASGMRFCRPQFLQKLLELAQKAGALIIFDEVMTGFGRTGTLFACEQMAIKPHILCLSKALTGGFLPLAVTLCQDEIYQAFLSQDVSKAFLHGHSYTANPLGCAAANASLDLFAQEDCLSKIHQIHGIHQKRLQRLRNIPGIEKCRTMGPIAAFNISGVSGYKASIGLELRQAFMGEHLILRPLGPVVYLLPPYCIELEALEEAYDCIENVLKRVLSS
jgi:adenosylmethionine-8-amino-7-oxononanoate aminotransferase